MQTILEIEKKIFKEKSLNLAFFSLSNGDSCAKKGRKSICKDNHYRGIVLVKISWQQGECLFVFILKVSFYSLTMANFPITSHVSPFSDPLPLSVHFHEDFDQI